MDVIYYFISENTYIFARRPKEFDDSIHRLKDKTVLFFTN